MMKKESNNVVILKYIHSVLIFFLINLKKAHLVLTQSKALTFIANDKKKNENNNIEINQSKKPQNIVDNSIVYEPRVPCVECGAIRCVPFLSSL